MTSPSPTPQLDAAPEATAASRARTSPNALTITAIVGFLGVLLALGGLAWTARPLRTPTQDCGSALTFLWNGRVNIFTDPANPPKGVTSAAAKNNNAKPCQARAGERARPGAIALGTGTALALLAGIVEGAIRIHRRRAERPDFTPRAETVP